METTKTNVWKIGWVVGIMLVVFLAVISIKELKSIAYVGKDVPIMNSITINGKGEMISIPDVATFSFSVTETAKDVDAAQTAATTKTNAAIKAMKDNGVEDKDIKTTAYNISPHYEYQNVACTANYCPGGKSVLTGYEVSQTIEIKVRDLKKAGSLFSTIGSLGVQNVNSLAFAIDDIDKVKAQAQKLAIADAKAKAKVLAAQLGVKIVRVMSFYDNSDQPVYGYGRDMMTEKAMSIAPQAATPPSLPAGEQKVTSNVSISYEIR
jgi:uncharacterized protein YggE